MNVLNLKPKVAPRDDSSQTQKHYDAAIDKAVDALSNGDKEAARDALKGAIELSRLTHEE